MKKDHKRMCFYMDMDSPDISEFFPVTCQKRLLLFLSNYDGEFSRRKIAFEAMLYELATKDDPNNSFSTSLMNVLFSRAYLREYKWPTSA